MAGREFSGDDLPLQRDCRFTWSVFQGGQSCAKHAPLSTGANTGREGGSPLADLKCEIWGIPCRARRTFGERLLLISIYPFPAWAKGLVSRVSFSCYKEKIVFGCYCCKISKSGSFQMHSNSMPLRPLKAQLGQRQQHSMARKASAYCKIFTRRRLTAKLNSFKTRLRLKTYEVKCTNLKLHEF